MPRPWRKPRQDKEARRVGAPRDSEETETAVDGASAPSGPDASRLNERLEAVTSQYVRPPSAAELRAVFGRKDDSAGADGVAAGNSFESQYPAESLFVPTPEPPLEEDAHGEDRSRTGGDYYYDPDDAWAVLGLHAGAAWSDIAAAHRRLAKKHHPDRLLDASAEARAESEATMREINVAYSVLRRMTGH